MGGFCRACLVQYEDSSELLQYTEKNRRLYVYSTGLQVKQTQEFPFYLCQACVLKMKSACLFKKQCRTSDKRLNHFLSLKEAGEETDFPTYLQQTEGSFLLKFPLNGTSTPSFQKINEDDNVSTSTSIRNFMTDILRDDEIPDTEARIIREMIEQEANVLDESLDTQWLQDDISIASDFRFSPFSTPLSKYNDQPANNKTPVKEDACKDEQITNPRNILAAKKLLIGTKSCSSSQTQSSSYRQESLDEESNLSAKKRMMSSRSSFSESQETKGSVEMDINHESYIAKKRILLNSKHIQNEREVENKQGKDMETFLATKSILLNSNPSSEKETEEPTEVNEQYNIAAKATYESYDEENIKNKDVLISHKGFYVEADDHIIQINDIGKELGKRDNIDKNLENILNNTNDEVISLTALLASPCSKISPASPKCNGIIATPSVHQGLSGANTPTIENILFGEKVENQQSVNLEPDYKQEDIDSDKSCQSDILDDFFNKETGDYIGDVKQSPGDTFEEFETPKVNAFMPSKTQYDLTDFSCKKCNLKYKSERGLKIHFSKAHKFKIISQRQKEPRTDMACDKCGKIFSFRSNLTKHIKVMHTAPKTAQTCKVCSLEFSTEAKLRLHMKSHGEVVQKPERENYNKSNLICPICGHVSSKLFNMKTHIARHTKDYAFKCDICDRGFYRKSEIQIHMRIHMNVKPFICKKCPDSFRRKDQLQIHMKGHAGDKPYTCDICNKKYVTIAKLKSHKKNSITCQNMKIEADLKANKEIEESIEQLYVTETLVKLDTEKIVAMLKENAQTDEQGNTKPLLENEADDEIQNQLEDITMEDLIVIPSQLESKVEDLDGDDKISLSEMFTIPIIIDNT